MKGIIKADQRAQAPRHINIALLGPSGVGKTTQASTLDPATTLFVDLEAGTLALQGWAGDVFDVRAFASEIGAHPWEMTRALALFIGGADPADNNGPYSLAVYDQLAGVLGDPSSMNKYETVFIDSITVASRWCFGWAQMQPDAFSEKTGKPDKRGAYGVLGQELVRWLTHLQHARKSIIVSGILDRMEDDLKRVTYSPQIEGGKASREITGIFDQVITMEYCYDDFGKPLLHEGKKIRAFYPTDSNRFGFPAKDRSGTLDGMEEPNLGGLIAKIRRAKRVDATVTTLPEQPAPQTDTQTATA